MVQHDTNGSSSSPLPASYLRSRRRHTRSSHEADLTLQLLMHCACITPDVC
jgi:hypothetical protein